MTGIRTLVVEDEPVTREWLAGLVREDADLLLVGTCADGREALDAIGTARPQLVFLDVQLPELNGFGVVEALAKETAPAVVFVTAFEEHAVRAFDIQALDYLVKPFSSERFRVAVARAKERLLAARQHELAQRIVELASGLGAAAAPSRLAVRDGRREIFLTQAQITWIEADGNYVRVHTAGAAYGLRSSIGELETRLAQSGFIRVHRGALVNSEHLRELFLTEQGEHEAVLASGERLRIGRTYLERVRRHLSGSP